MALLVTAGKDPRQVEQPWVELPATDPLRDWLREARTPIAHVAPVASAGGRHGVLVFDLQRPEDGAERARLAALATLYARHAATTFSVVSTSIQLEAKNAKLEEAQRRLVEAADEIRSLNASLERRVAERTKGSTRGPWFAQEGWLRLRGAP